MKKKTFVFFINITVLLLVLSFPSFAQAPKKEFKVIPKEVVPLYNGTFVGVDVYGIGSKMLGGNFMSSEVSVDMNLKNRFFPVLEAGFGATNTDNEEGFIYKSSAPYFRIGMNYNTMFKKKSLSHLYVGVRYAFSAMSYDVKGPALKDDIWPGEVPFEYSGEKTTAQWIELVIGVRAQIYKNFLMGWALRYKSRLSVKENVNTTPWYIPGFGENKSTTFGVTYSLIYKLPF